MEEKFIPLEIELYIIEHLNEKDLYHYGMTCRSALHTSSLVWKNKSIKTWNCKVDTAKDQPNFWFQYYMACWSKVFNYEIKEWLDSLFYIVRYKDRINGLESVFLYLSQNKLLIETQRYGNFRKVLQTKLLENKFCANAEPVYREFFPETYEENFSYGLDKLFEGSI
jgi:hypothetical protein